MRWAGHVARMGEERGCIGSWWGNRREGNHWGDLGIDGWIILGWISRRWDVGIWTRLGWPRVRDRWRTLVSAVMNLRVPWNAGNFLTSCKPVSFSRRTLHHGVSKCIIVVAIDKHRTAWDKVLLEKLTGTQVMNTFCAVTARLGTRPPHCWGFQTARRHPHPIGLLWTRDQHENCTLLGYYAASSGNSLSTFRYRYVVPKCR